MFWLKFMTPVVFAGYWFGSDANVQVFIIDGIIEYFHPEYFENPAVLISEDSENENAIVANFTIIKTLPVTSEGHLEVIGASMGEYAQPTGFDFDMDLCDLIKEPVMVGATLYGFGFKAEECPPIPGIYGTNGYHFDASELPDELPLNKYKVHFNITDSGKPILCTTFLVEIQ